MEVKAEKVNPYSGDKRNKSSQVREMFNNIAPAYDVMNRMMTFGGIDRLWRRKAIREVADASPAEVLDIATGTADLAIEIARNVPGAKVTGIDLSEGMIEIGRQKVARHGLGDRIVLEIADCLALPFGDNSFDCATVAFGVRNFEHLTEGYREILRTLRPGGTLFVLELSTPDSPVVRPFYDLYAGYVIPAVGRLVSKDVSAYSYLQKSIAAVPKGKDMTALMEQAGFTGTSFRKMTFGTCTLYKGKKRRTFPT